MSLVSLLFLGFLALVFLCYYLVPAAGRWIVLLSASLVFYISYDYRYLLFIAAASIVTYVCGRKMASVYSQETDKAGKALQKKKCKKILIPGVILLILMLVYAKAGERILEAIASLAGGDGSAIHVLVPLGISYYTFSAVGYLADVYWRKDQAENSYPRLLLYLIYFPQIVQGPIPRHKKLASQLSAVHRFDYTQFTFGLQRMVWGYLKKTVIADRFGVMVSAILADYQNMSGVILFLGIMLSAVQLYADFSGCMDIVIGISQSMGITLEENFRQPFFSKSAAEFWRRWHITLGSWFRDYVYMPVVVSPGLMKLSRKVKDRFGRKAASNTVTVIALAIVWILTGLWHGTGPDYLVWGCYWGVLIICGTIFDRQYKALDEKLHIDTKSRLWQCWQMVRTFLIYCGGRLLTAPGSLTVTRQIIKAFFSRPYFGALRDGTLLSLGLDGADLIVGCIGIALLWTVSVLKEKGVDIRQRVAAWKLPARWALYYGVILFVVLCGKYGPAFDGGSFIYAGF